MSHMLIMATGQLGDPMIFFVFVVPDNGLLHTDANLGFFIVDKQQ